MIAGVYEEDYNEAPRIEVRDIRAEFCRTRSGFALNILTPLKILISVSGYDGQKKMGGIPLTSIDLVNHGLTGTDVIRNIF